MILARRVHLTLFVACLLYPCVAHGPAPAGDRVEGWGAAGVCDVGRPLDVVRERAGRRARRRAVDALAAAALDLAMAGSGAHTAKVDRGIVEQRARRAAAGRQAAWELRYWSNGAVTARVSVPAGEVAGP